MTDHNLALILVRTTPRSGSRWEVPIRLHPDAEAAIKARQAENVTRMHRMHRPPEQLAEGCFAVWSEYGTIPVNGLITWRLEKFATVDEAEWAFTDRMHQDIPLPHHYAELGVTDVVDPRTPLSRLWVYRTDPRPGPGSVLPEFGFEVAGEEVVRVLPDTEDDQRRHLVRAEDLRRRSMAGEMAESQVF